MDYSTALLQLARAGDVLRAAFHEKNGSSESTLRPFEIHAVPWDQVNAECREILTLLGRANRPGNGNSEALARLKRCGQLLFDLLLPLSLKTKLAHTVGRSITLDVDDSLIHIPWHLLYDGREFFCRRFAMGRIVNTRQAPVMRSERQLRPPFSVLILADPRGDLEAAYREGLALRNFLDQRREIFRVDLKSYPVDVAFVKKILRDYDIVHYAGHALYHAENPAESGWLLRDGTLSAGAIASMGGSRPMPALVFANACQSGRADSSQHGAGRDDQISGFASAFLVAGVRHYVGSFGDIVDEAGGIFARDFYSALADGNAVGIALRQARLVSIDRFGETQLNWSRYMLYGAPDFEFCGESRSLPAYKPSREDWISRSNLLRGSESEKEVEVNKLRARPRIAAWLAVAAIGLLTSSFWRWNKKPAGPQATATAASVMNVSALSDSNTQAQLRLSMQVIGQRKESDGRFTEIVVSEGGVLRSGDQFQVRINSKAAAYIYIILYDSHSHASKLFPDPKIEQPGFIAAHHEIAIPDKHLWFWLDNHPGIETIYVLASTDPLPNISEILAKMESVQITLDKPGPVQRQERIKSVQRGVGGFAHAKAMHFPLVDSNLIKRVTAVVVSSGAAVRALSFRHK